MSTLSICIEDPNQWLSKTQKHKIRQWFKKAIPSENYDEILSMIHYAIPDQKYCAVTVTSVAANEYKVSFSDVIFRNPLRDRLTSRIREKKQQRIFHGEDTEAWNCYHRLLNQPHIQKLSAQQRAYLIPDPSHIQKNKMIYEPLCAMAQFPPPIKEYWKMCL